MNKKKLFKKIENLVVNPNCCKYLYSGKKKAFWAYFRNRAIDTFYYRVRIKGNYIRGYRIKYVDQAGRCKNTYLDVFIPALLTGEHPKSVPVEVKELLVKEKFKNAAIFAAKFRELTPDLGWD